MIITEGSIIVLLNSKNSEYLYPFLGIFVSFEEQLLDFLVKTNLRILI